MTEARGGSTVRSSSQPHGFPKEARLLRRADFERLRRPHARVETPSFRLAASPSLTGRPRLGMAVSRKVGSAVVRNRIRRCIREVFRTADLAPLDVLVVVKPGAAGSLRGRTAVERELVPAWGRAAQRASKRRRPR